MAKAIAAIAAFLFTLFILGIVAWVSLMVLIARSMNEKSQNYTDQERPDLTLGENPTEGAVE